MILNMMFLNLLYQRKVKNEFKIYAVWLAFFLNLSFAIVEFIAGESLGPVLFSLTLSMTWGCSYLLASPPF